MPLNLYDNCPCGSGKKGKWCCAPYFDRVQDAFDLQQRGQHAAAVDAFEKLVAEHPDKPQVYGYYANLLFGEDQPEKAEAVLEKAFELAPHFPMGYLLRGVMRQQEGEVIGALLLFRKAAEHYSPDAHDQLAQVYEMIARNEVVLNRPVASRAALERACHFAPADAELRQQFEGIFGADSRLPESARRAYKFRPTAKPVAAVESGRFGEVKQAFQALTQEVPDDPAGWFNLALCHAWLGEQPMATAALARSLELEWDDAKAEEASALAEVLSCGHGMEDDSDYLEHRVVMPVRDPETLFQLVQVMHQEGRVLAAQMDPDGQFFSCLVVEPVPNLLETGTAVARARANLSIAAGVLRLWHPSAENIRRVADEIRQRVNLAVGEPTEGTGVSQFQDIHLEAMALPVRTANVADAEKKMADQATHHFEEVWLHRPRKSLGGNSPVDATGSTLMRKRLLGVLKFNADCFRAASPRKPTPSGGSAAVEVYDFERLRHKLGADLRPAGDAPTIRVPEQVAAPATPATPPSAPRDWAAMSVADLAAEDVTHLTVVEAEAAMRAALKLDARELAVRFAKAGATRPADPARPDRYPLFACVIAGATAEGDLTTALDFATQGRADDEQHNGATRAGEYGLQRARLLARRGDIPTAAAEFDALLTRFPAEPKFVIAATEAMLSAKQPDHAAQFAERGLALAKKLNNRDLEAASQELAEAAKRMR